MELKNYQKKSMRDLSSYLHFLNTEHNMVTAYQRHWNAQDVRVGFGGVPTYRDTIHGTPHVCFKVPTGGGKTFMACAAVKPIFDAMPPDKPRVVAWLVPSNAILEQTIQTLSNVDHPYRQRLDFDFSGRVMVYTKEQLLNGQNFSPDTVRDQLSICILSYDTLRIDSKNRDIRKAYQENSQLASFAKNIVTPETLLPDVDDTALMQVLNQLSPVVIVDESHNTTSPYSVEMLNNLNPSFVLDLTATPRSNSNIISYVDARELKQENMVKLPVVVYNRNSRSSVILDAIQLRGSIEQQAKAEEAGGGAYIRPIVLFQAQPKTNEDSETFDRIKAKMVNMGILPEQIAIKTSKVNELKNVDLMSRDCPIRYIITVNALKEGWDCPFAYILASLANKTSAVDVEQIVGRILRQPYAKQHHAPLLNTSYVLTCSNDFRDTLNRIVKGLNKAGFTEKDFYAPEEQGIAIPPTEQPVQIKLDDLANGEQDGFEDIVPEDIREALAQDTEALPPSVAAMMEVAAQQSEAYGRAVADNDGNGFLGGELGTMMNQFQMQDAFAVDAQALAIPQFAIRVDHSLFGGDSAKLAKETLSDGFSLNGQDAQVDFSLNMGDMYRIDIEAQGEAVPKYQKTSQEEGAYIRDLLAKMPEQRKVEFCTNMLCQNINRSDRLAAADVNAYVKRIVAEMTVDELAALETAVPTYARKIQEKISVLEDAYREVQFNKLLDNGTVFCTPSYMLSEVITPVDHTKNLAKSLYEAERDDMNGQEFRTISALAALDTVQWWHRIMDSKPTEFVLNGFLNHYPDFMLMTTKGVLVLVEVKGDDRDNDDSRAKLRLGRRWAACAGTGYRYFMVFDKKDIHQEGAYTLDAFIEMAKGL
ncbi:MAG: DEAD/DEAH box helicase family protein, partial [Clostridia bacterium]